MSGHVLVTAPTEKPVELDEFREFAKIQHDQESDFISLCMDSAIGVFESVTRRKLMRQTWRLDLDCFNESKIQLPHIPAVAVSSLQYYDADNVQQTLATSAYYVDMSALHFAVTPALDTNWPSVYYRKDAVSITYTAGYENAAAVPSDIKFGLNVVANQMHQNRDTDVKLEFATALFKKYVVSEFY